jgi:hypothetical protein
MPVLFTRLGDREIAQLHQLATMVIGAHQNHDDLCVICGSAWPCERAVLAEHNLEID